MTRDDVLMLSGVFISCAGLLTLVFLAYLWLRESVFRFEDDLDDELERLKLLDERRAW